MISSTNTIYLDMDGVVADFQGAVNDIVGARQIQPHEHYSDEDWQQIRSHQRLFGSLRPLEGADQLVDQARMFRSQLGWNLLFLTAIPHTNDMPWVFWDKMQWVQRYWPDIAVHFGPHSHDKHLHCRPGDVLVDDRGDNCGQWRRAGGRAIHYRSRQQALADLRIVYRQLALDKAA